LKRDISIAGPGVFLLRDSQNGNAVKIRGGRAAVSACSDIKSEIREALFHCQWQSEDGRQKS
jgi:hypothetical protein